MRSLSPTPTRHPSFRGVVLRSVLTPCPPSRNGRGWVAREGRNIMAHQARAMGRASTPRLSVFGHAFRLLGLQLVAFLDDPTCRWLHILRATNGSGLATLVSLSDLVTASRERRLLDPPVVPPAPPRRPPQAPLQVPVRAGRRAALQRLRASGAPSFVNDQWRAQGVPSCVVEAGAGSRQTWESLTDEQSLEAADTLRQQA